MKQIITFTILLLSLACCAQYPGKPQTKKYFEEQDEKYRAGTGLIVTGFIVYGIGYSIFDNAKDDRADGVVATSAILGTGLVVGGSFYIKKAEYKSIPKDL